MTDTGNATETDGTPVSNVNKINDATEEVVAVTTETQTDKVDHSPATMQRKVSVILEDLETPDTKDLCLRELERIVLLKQLKILTKQEKLIKKQETVADLQLRRLRCDDDGDLF